MQKLMSLLKLWFLTFSFLCIIFEWKLIWENYYKQIWQFSNEFRKRILPIIIITFKERIEILFTWSLNIFCSGIIVYLALFLEMFNICITIYVKSLVAKKMILYFNHMIIVLRFMDIFFLFFTFILWFFL